MEREFCKLKTGFKKVKQADSARADSPGILTFFSLVLASLAPCLNTRSKAIDPQILRVQDGDTLL